MQLSKIFTMLCQSCVTFPRQCESCALMLPSMIKRCNLTSHPITGTFGAHGLSRHKHTSAHGQLLLQTKTSGKSLGANVKHLRECDSAAAIYQQVALVPTKLSRCTYATKNKNFVFRPAQLYLNGDNAYYLILTTRQQTSFLFLV